MYVPPQFREERREVLLAAMAEIRLATFVTAAGDAYHATHVPTVVEDGEPLVLTAHVARANPHWRALVGGVPSLAIFQGPHAYVSPSWYASKAEHGKVVPTWNYIAVHAHGTLEAVDDPDWRHVFKCSPCYREVRALQQAAGERREGFEEPRRWSPAMAAAAALVLALAGGWFVWSRPGTTPTTDARARASSVEARANWDYRKYTVTPALGLSRVARMWTLFRGTARLR